MKSKKHSDKSKVDKKKKREYSSDEEFDVFEIDEKSGEAVAKLKHMLKECQQERREFLDGWQRSKAELINARKQDVEQNKKAFLRIQEDFILRLLPILDSFDMAFADTKEEVKVDSDWVVGVQNIHSQLKAFLSSVGVSTIEQIGEPFDPKKHDSAETVLTKKREEDGLIVEVLQKGYVFGDSIVRAARVRVAEFNV